MTKEAALAQLRSAAWALAAIVGYAEAARIVRTIASEINDKLWDEPGGR